MTNVDSVREFLQSKGQQYISVNSLSDLARESKMSEGSFTAAFYKLRTLGEIDTDVDISENGRRSIKGITLKKMPSASTIIKNEGEKKKAALTPSIPKLETAMPLPHTIAYLKQKKIIADIKTKIAESGFFDNPDEMVNFPVNPLGEEAIALLDLLQRAQTALGGLVDQKNQLEIDLESQKKIADSYAARLRIKPEDYREEAK